MGPRFQRRADIPFVNGQLLEPQLDEILRGDDAAEVVARFLAFLRRKAAEGRVQVMARGREGREQLRAKTLTCRN